MLPQPVSSQTRSAEMPRRAMPIFVPSRTRYPSRRSGVSHGPTASLIRDSGTRTPRGLERVQHTKKREKCTHCIHPALTRDSGRALRCRPTISCATSGFASANRDSFVFALSQSLQTIWKSKNIGMRALRGFHPHATTHEKSQKVHSLYSPSVY